VNLQVRKNTDHKYIFLYLVLDYPS
jgi:hypothetical protein